MYDMFWQSWIKLSRNVLEVQKNIFEYLESPWILFSHNSEDHEFILLLCYSHFISFVFIYCINSSSVEVAIMHVLVKLLSVTASTACAVKYLSEAILVCSDPSFRKNKSSKSFLCVLTLLVFWSTFQCRYNSHWQSTIGFQCFEVCLPSRYTCHCFQHLFPIRKVPRHMQRMKSIV